MKQDGTCTVQNGDNFFEAIANELRSRGKIDVPRTIALVDRYTQIYMHLVVNILEGKVTVFDRKLNI